MTHTQQTHHHKLTKSRVCLVWLPQGAVSQEIVQPEATVLILALALHMGVPNQHTCPPLPSKKHQVLCAQLVNRWGWHTQISPCQSSLALHLSRAADSPPPSHSGLDPQQETNRQTTTDQQVQRAFPRLQQAYSAVPRQGHFLTPVPILSIL